MGKQNKFVQTSTHRFGKTKDNEPEDTAQSMRSFKTFMDNILVTVKHSTFALNSDDRQRPSFTQHLFPLQDSRPNQRLDVRIYNPAINCWRTLRTLQTKKLQFELRVAFNEKLLNTDHFPGWSVTFNPPTNLLTSTRAIESTVGFRYEQSKNFIRMVNDLMREESDRLTNEIQATMASLECHYQEEAAREYDIREALEALQTLVLRAKQKEEDELANRYDQIHQAPLAALWENLPEGTVLPPAAVRTDRSQPASAFRETGRGNPRRPSWRGRGRGRGNRPTRGRGVTQARGTAIQGTRNANRQTVQAMMTLLNGMIENY